jgi:hypothetical protein
MSYFAVSFNSIRTTQLQSLSTIWHVLGHLEFFARRCIFWTPQIGIFGPRNIAWSVLSSLRHIQKPFSGCINNIEGIPETENSQKIRGSFRAPYLCLKTKITFLETRRNFISVNFNFNSYSWVAIVAYTHISEMCMIVCLCRSAQCALHSVLSIILFNFLDP